MGEKLKWAFIGAGSVIGLAVAFFGGALAVGAAVERGRVIAAQRRAADQAPPPFRRTAKPMV